MKRIFLTIAALCLMAGQAMAFNFNFGFNFGGKKGVKYVDLAPVMVWQNYTPTPGSYAFGNHSTGTTTDKVLTLSNTGNDVLESASLAVAGTGFTLQSTTCGANPFNLALLTTCTATVRFSPVAVTSYTGTITASAPNLTDQVVNLSGAGTASVTNNTYTISNTDNGGYTMSNTRTLGQTFTVLSGQGGPLQSITIKRAAGGTNITFTARIGIAGSLDMTSSYVEGTVVSTTASVEVSIPITGITLAEGSTYALAVQSSGSCGLTYATTSVYSGGYQYENTTGASWDLTSHQATTHELYLKYTVAQ